MTCTGTTCNQGRAACASNCSDKPKPKHSCDELGVCQSRTPPCTASCGQQDHDASPYGGPWDWVDDLREATLMTLALVAAAAALGTAIFWIFIK